MTKLKNGDPTYKGITPRVITFVLLCGILASGFLLWNQEKKKDVDRAAEQSLKAEKNKEWDNPRSVLMVTNSVMDWRLIESADYRSYISNLRKAQCPERTLQDIVIADVNGVYKEKAKKAMAAAESGNRFQYWKQQPLAETNRAPMLAILEVIENERKQMLTTLLGPDWVDVSGFSIVTALAIPNTELDVAFLSAEKRSLVKQLKEDHKKALHDRFPGGTVDEAGFADFVKLKKALEADIKANLTADEYKQYVLNDSETADSLRRRLNKAFRPSEAEFKAIFEKQFAIDERFGGELSEPLMEPHDVFERTQAETKMKSELRAMLGDERYAEYERSMDLNYELIKRFTDQNKTDESTLNEIYDLKRAFTNRAQEIRINTVAESPEQQAQLEQLRSSAVAELEKRYGQAYAQSYMQDLGAARWVKSLGQAQPSDARLRIQPILQTN